MTDSPPGNTLRLAGVAALLVVVLGLHIGMCTYFADRGEMGADEGFYAIAARSVMDGDIPYRDFAYTQMPLLPYWNGVFMKLFGFTMDTQRILNIAWSTIGLICIILALRQRTGRWEPGLAAAFCVVASPQWSSLQAIGTSHGAAGMFLAMSTAAVIGTFSTRKRVWFLAIAGTLAIGCRLSCAPVVALLGLALVIETKKSLGSRLKTLAILTGVPVLALLPFFLLAPENSFFNVWEYHLASSIDRRSVGNWVQWWQIAPAALLVLVAGLATLPSLIRRRSWTLVILLAAALVGVTTPMIPRSAYGLYIAPAVLLASAAGMAAPWSLVEKKPSPFRHVVWLLPLLALYYDLPATEEDHASAGMTELATQVKKSAGPGPILTPLTIVAVEADREVLPGTEMGMFSVMAPANRELARRLKLTTLKDMSDALRKRKPAAVVMRAGKSKWNFRWAVPTLRSQPRKELAAMRRALLDNYRVAFRNDDGTVLLPRTP